MAGFRASARLSIRLVAAGAARALHFRAALCARPHRIELIEVGRADRRRGTPCPQIVRADIGAVWVHGQLLPAAPAAMVAPVRVLPGDPPPAPLEHVPKTRRIHLCRAAGRALHDAVLGGSPIILSQPSWS